MQSALDVQLRDPIDSIGAEQLMEIRENQKLLLLCAQLLAYF